MKRHVKASTVGSTQRQAKGLGRFFRGADAGREVSLTSKGSGASIARRLVLPVGIFATILALVLSAGSAIAANGVTSFFGGEGATGGKFGSTNGGPGGVAVNQEGTGGATTGDVYVVDRGNNRIQQFSASGAFVRAFGLNVGGAGVNVCTAAASCVAGTASAAAGGMSAPQGIAIDQANGNVYVTDQANKRVDVFSATGVFQGALGWKVDVTGAAEELQLCTVSTGCQAGTSGANAGQFGAAIGYPAVAPAGSPNAGHVYVADMANRRVDEFEPTLTSGEVTAIAFIRGWGWGVDTGVAEFQRCTTASVCQAPNTSSPTSNPGQFSENQPRALAVDTNGNVYTAEGAGNNRAQKFDSEGNPVAFNATELNGSPGPADIAVDKTNNHLFAIKEVTGTGEKRVLELNSGGSLLSTHASGTTITSANGLALIQGTTNFYMTTNQSATFRGVFFLGTKVAPTASVEAPTPIAAHSATLKGKVNPTGLETTYHFELSADKGATWTNVPASDASAGSGSGEVAVSQAASGLIGGHEYRVKLVATKVFGAGGATSSTVNFTTGASAPEITATFSSAVTTNSAVLGAEIGAQNQATTYHFEYGTEDCSTNPCTSIPIPDAGIGSGELAVSVAKEIGGLVPATTYHYRVVATNATNTTEGPDRTFTTYTTRVDNTSCSNQQFRTGASAALPDCRAYEMVSPVDKKGGDAVGIPGFNDLAAQDQSSISGQKMTFSAFRAFGDAESAGFASQYMATRGADGWTNHSISATRGATFAPGGVPVIESEFKAFSPDLSTALVWHDARPPLTPDSIKGLTTLYTRNNISEAYEGLTTTTPPNVNPFDFPFNSGEYYPEFEAFSNDASNVIFVVKGVLLPEASLTGVNLYEWTSGKLRLVSVLPNGTPSPTGGSAGTANTQIRSGHFQNVSHAISDDGSRVFWSSSATGPAKLYLRENATQTQSAVNGSGECTESDKACTIPVSETVSTAAAHFWTANPEGSKAIFSLGEDLYEFDVETKTSTLIAHKVSGLLGASESASYVYFTSSEVLASGATVGQPNLYLDKAGTMKFIGTLVSADTSSTNAKSESPIHVRPIRHTARVSPDGRHLAFDSAASLSTVNFSSGYDNTDVNTGKADVEVYVYAAEAEQLTCVSCNPSGARPEGGELELGAQQSLGHTFFGAATIPPWENELYATRALSNDGTRLFFNSHDALVPWDTNGVTDVFEWEAQGSGDCREVGGCINLISTGKGTEDSEFVDATPSGGDVFFRTSESLDPQDPGLIDVYDARVEGGFPLPPSPPECAGDACQSAPEAPNDATPASVSFRGAGNPAPLRKSGRSCRARKGHATKRRHKKAKQKPAKRCKRVSQRAGR